MTTSCNALPDITRSDVGTILVSPWLVGTPQRQRDAVDATIEEWQNAPQPKAFLSLNCFVSGDGATVLNYAQWTDDDAHREFMRTYRPALVRGIDEVVPGIERPGLVRYRLHGSLAATERGRGEVVAVFTSDANGIEHARNLLDEARARIGAESDLPPGLHAVHFHISIDGARVLIYEEWSDEAAATNGTHHLEPPTADNLYRLHRSITHYRS
ncbi:hypothetical protein MOQ72_04770 [Saccharopolyspora sp. K220]|uniref:hypothetical protein n=1 Tax=Saccharopolyspora soli TaxID=2926618 RepID=UPI001F593184|nr:hypothetical protein [Saccharopolyspora soli]MCI2416727.1 hypothetical protein [Saccharopolyspora soli]